MRSVFLLLWLWAHPGWSQLPVVSIPSKIEEATIYMNGAEIRATYSIDVREGLQQVVFRNLSPHLDEKSIHFSCSDLEVLSISSSAARESTEDAALKLLKDSLDLFDYQIERVQNEIGAYETEKRALEKNHELMGTNAQSLENLSRGAEFFRTRTLEANHALTDLQRRLRILHSKRETLQKHLDELRKVKTSLRKEIQLVVQSDKAKKISFILRYLVGHTGWSATYDLISKEVNAPVLLKYKAEIYNNTGIDWKDTKITLSTADPTLGAARPFLSPWLLNRSVQMSNEGMLESKSLGWHFHRQLS